MSHLPGCGHGSQFQVCAQKKGLRSYKMPGLSSWFEGKNCLVFILFPSFLFPTEGQSTRVFLGSNSLTGVGVYLQGTSLKASYPLPLSGPEHCRAVADLFPALQMCKIAFAHRVRGNLIVFPGTLPFPTFA